jgi:hypothetical protein
MSPAYLARRVVASIIAEKPRLLIAGKECALVYLNRFTPGMHAALA